MLYCSEKVLQGSLSAKQLDEIIEQVVAKVSKERELKRVLVIPPDFTRFHSRSVEITSKLYSWLADAISLVLPA